MANETPERGSSPEAKSLRRHGLQHPEERFEFARFCLLNHYACNDRFVAKLEELASRHEGTLDAVARQPLSRGISELADYRIAWGVLFFLVRDPASGKAAHPLKGMIDSYRAELSSLSRRGGLGRSLVRSFPSSRPAGSDGVRWQL